MKIFKEQLKDKTYRALVIGASIFEGFMLLIFAIACINQNRSLMVTSFLFIVIELFTIGVKLSQYEKNVLKMGVR
ncbi:MAG: hypothetical protein ACOC56_04075 [Atribacterota bacterium]